MTIKELIKELENYNDDDEVDVSVDISRDDDIYRRAFGEIIDTQTGQGVVNLLCIGYVNTEEPPKKRRKR
jgi:hypothetical protein